MSQKTKNILLNGVILLFLVVVAIVASSGWIQILATVTGIIGVYFMARGNLWNYPINMISIIAIIYTAWHSKLYADAVLQTVFLILSIYGLIYWIVGKQDKQHSRPIKHLTRKHLAVLVVIGIAIVIGWGHVLTNVGDSAPYLDALTATIGIIAQYLFSSKIFENWYPWMAMDIFSIGLYTYKGIYIFTFLYLVYFFIAFSGFITWRKQLKQQKIYSSTPVVE